MTYRAAILIPNHNHKDTIANLLDQLASHKIECLIVDDGSEPETARVLKDQSQRHDWVHLLRRSTQGGKGAAVKEGLLYLHRAGFTHALQIDADGQHDVGDLPKFLATSRAEPNALVLGTPKYGPEVPWSRLLGRQISRALVWLETFSFAISDPLLGYRVYPLKETTQLLESERLGERMDFDPEIAVRLKWKRLPIRNIPTTVIYPENGHSNFKMFTDNLRMVKLHFRLSLAIVRYLSPRGNT